MNVFQFFNQHSFLMISAAALIIFALGLAARRARRGWLIWGALVLVTAGGWYTLRTTNGLHLNTAADYEAAIRSGQPTLIEFYSNY